METMVFLTLLRTQLILEEDAIDARCLPVERCWTEIFLSQMMRRWEMTFVARRLLGLVFRRRQDSARKMILRQDMT